MNELTQLWLQMLLLVALVGAAGRARAGWRWNLGGILQQGLLVAIAAFGLLVGAASACAAVGWALMIGFDGWSRVLQRRIAHNLVLLDAASAEEEAARLRLFAWGAPGRFWQDAAHALSLALDDQRDDARALVARYLVAPTPLPYRASAAAMLQSLRVLEQDWEGILRDYTRLVPEDDTPMAAWLASGVARALLEIGDVAGARRVLERSEETGFRRTGPEVVRESASFYALAGASDDLERALATLDLPPHAADTWRARCLAARGQLAEAERVMAGAIAAVPEDQPRVAERLRRQATALPEAPTPGLDPATEPEVAAARRLFASRFRTASLLVPGRGSWAVPGLVALIAVAFVPAHVYQLFPTERALAFADWLQRVGPLSAQALAGEPWRLVTYQFMHADIFHVGLNLLVLWMFGRQAEALFGPWAVIVVFFASGVLGGVVQLEVAPGAEAIGASGAVLGVFGAVIAGLARSKDTLPAEIRRQRVGQLLSVAAFQMVLDQVFAGQIAVYIHAAGLFAGGALGLVAPLRRSA